MTKDLTAAKRYAKALYEVAAESGITEQAIAELKEAVTVLAHPELELVLSHPNIDANVKTDLLLRIFEGKVSEAVLNLLRLLVERKRVLLIPAVCDEFVRIAGEALGRTEAVVYSPMPLSEQETASIQARFGAVTGKTIQVTNIVDQSLLGGIKVRIGDTLYDGSLSGKLKRLEKTLQASQVM
jgi:F-type H+-transporting ATPase subunit delta